MTHFKNGRMQLSLTCKVNVVTIKHVCAAHPLLVRKSLILLSQTDQLWKQTVNELPGQKKMYSVITYCTSNTRLFRDSRWQCILCRFWRSTQQQQEQGAFPTNLPTWQSLQTGTVCKMATRNSSTHNRLASMSWILFRHILFPVVISRDIRPCWKVQILSWP